MNSIREITALTEKEQLLRKVIEDYSNGGKVVVAFSGGVDSGLLLWECTQALGAERVVAITVISPTSIPGELECAKEYADLLGVEHIVVAGGECDDPAFLRNPENRCYICKNIRYKKLIGLANELGIFAIMDGTQADDRLEDRPGMRALKELGISTPLAESGLGKEEVRVLLRESVLRKLADKTAQPCLATRIPYGRDITLDALDRVRQGESLLHGFGLKTIRLRDHFPIARIVLDTNGMSILTSDSLMRGQIVRNLKKLGYEYVTLDLTEYGG